MTTDCCTSRWKHDVARIRPIRVHVVFDIVDQGSPGIESRWGRFSAPIQSGPPGHLYNGYWVKRPGRGVDHPPSSSARVKERVELYLYSPSGPSWPILGRTLPLPGFYIHVELFSKMSIPGLEPTQPPIQWVPGFFPGGKVAGA
jgi:hypothetical protein